MILIKTVDNILASKIDASCATYASEAWRAKPEPHPKLKRLSAVRKLLVQDCLRKHLVTCLQTLAWFLHVFNMIWYDPCDVFCLFVWAEEVLVRRSLWHTWIYAWGTVGTVKITWSRFALNWDWEVLVSNVLSGLQYRLFMTSWTFQLDAVSLSPCLSKVSGASFVVGHPVVLHFEALFVSAAVRPSKSRGTWWRVGWLIEVTNIQHSLLGSREHQKSRRIIQMLECQGSLSQTWFSFAGQAIASPPMRGH